MKGLVLAICLSTAWAPAIAQVYKCPQAGGGYAYQQDPCTKGTEVKVRGAKGATLTEGELASRQQVFKSTDMTEAGMKESRCLSAANENIYRPVNERAAGYQRQMGVLNQQLAGARNNLAGATYASGIRTQIASLQQSIASERSSADASMAAARQRCADQRRQDEQTIEKRYSKGE